MTRQIRGNSRRVATVVCMAAVAPLALVVPASAAPAAQAAPAAATASAARQYVALSKSGTTVRLQLVDRTTGKVLRTLDSVNTGRNGAAAGFGDVDLAADGSVYAVKWKGAGYGYGSPLVRYAGGRATVIAQYVRSVEASPSGKQLAVTIDSPDGDHDGKGLEALRILTTSGKVVRTLDSYAFPVTKEGWPSYETGGLQVTGWMNASTLVVRTGCCASSNVHIVRADKPTSMRSWPSLYGVDDTTAIGTKGASVLVARPYYRGRQMDNRLGVEVLWMTARQPKGKVVQRVAGRNAYTTTVADAINTKYRATPLLVSPKKFPYRSTGRVLAAFI